MKKIALLLIASLLFNCQKESAKTLNTDDFSIAISEYNDVKLSFKNSFVESPIIIEAEKITLEQLVSQIFKKDSIAFKYDSKDISDQAYVTSIQFKNDKFSSKKSALDFILKSYDLKFKIKQEPILNLTIADTTKLYKHYAVNATNNKSKIFKSKDSLSLENISLKKISELMNDKFSINTVSHSTNALIDYNIKFKDLNDFKSQLKTDLGLELQDTNTKKTTYLVSENE